MSKIFKEIKQERERQNKKWGEHMNVHPFTKCAVLCQETGEAAKAAHDAIFKGHSWEDYRMELIQVAAMAVQMIEQYDKEGMDIEKYKIK